MDNFVLLGWIMWEGFELLYGVYLVVDGVVVIRESLERFEVLFALLVGRLLLVLIGVWSMIE